MILVIFTIMFMSSGASGGTTNISINGNRVVYNVVVEGAAGDGRTDDGKVNIDFCDDTRKSLPWFGI